MSEERCPHCQAPLTESSPLCAHEPGCAVLAAMAKPPRPTGTLELFDSLNGMLMFSWGPVGSPSQIEPVQIHGGPLAVLVFSTMETLQRFRSEFPELKIGEGRILKIDDTSAFFEDIPTEICIALDVRRTEQGRIRYFDVSVMREPAQA